MTARTITSWRRWTIARLSAIALGVVLCAGCTTSDDEPAPTVSSPESSETATPEPSPTEVPPYDGTAAPQMPSDMASDSHLGARAAATYFVDVRHWAVISNDPSGLLELCDPESTFCASSVATISENAAAGATVQGGLPSFTISSVTPPTSEHDFYEIVGTVDEDPLAVKNAAGQIIQSTEGESIPFVVFAAFSPESGWLILGADTQVS